MSESKTERRKKRPGPKPGTRNNPSGRRPQAEESHIHRVTSALTEASAHWLTRVGAKRGATVSEMLRSFIEAAAAADVDIPESPRSKDEPANVHVHATLGASVFEWLEMRVEAMDRARSAIIRDIVEMRRRKAS